LLQVQLTFPAATVLFPLQWDRQSRREGAMAADHLVEFNEVLRHNTNFVFNHQRTAAKMKPLRVEVTAAS
jgi:hypothetical protein